ncbi:MAG: alanine racemase [Nitrospirota bacterium]
MTRGPIAEVDLSAIAHNLQAIRKIVKNRPVIAVVKADAYGHGAVEVSKRLLKEGVTCLAVAFTGEARELRDAGISIPVIVLFDRNDINAFFEFHLIPVISDVETALSLSNEAKRRNTAINVHIKIDTGMGRLGLHGKKVTENILNIASMPGIQVEGLLSHFSEADLADRSFADQQITLFRQVLESVSRKIKGKICAHIANSAAVMTLEESHFDAVRPGLMLYGYSPLKAYRFGSPENLPHVSELFPALVVKAKILSIRNVPSGTPISYGRTFVTKRQSRIGVVSIGYADGYSRLFSNNAEMLVLGKKAPVAGRVCMDLTMIDLTDIPEAQENDDAVIIGRQGSQSITADELAEKANTISYEILTSLGSRSRKVHAENH